MTSAHNISYDFSIQLVLCQEAPCHFLLCQAQIHNAFATGHAPSAELSGRKLSRRGVSVHDHVCQHLDGPSDQLLRPGSLDDGLRVHVFFGVRL